MTIHLAQPQSEKDWRQARQLIEEYAASLDLDLSFQNYADELEHFTSEHAPPTGAFLLAEEKGVYVGCVGVGQFSDRFVGEPFNIKVIGQELYANFEESRKAREKTDRDILEWSRHLDPDWLKQPFKMHEQRR